MKCDKCGNPAAAHIRYSGAHLCLDHLDEFIMDRVKREVRQSPYIPRRDGVLALAVSGGKDSLVLAHILHRIMGSWKGVRLHAITIDEGIEGYRPSSLDLARDFLGELGIDHTVLPFSEAVGLTLDEMTTRPELGDYSPCTYCGVFRRYLLNRAAREIGASAMAYGHNLDDSAQSVLMNVLRGDMKKLLKLAPHRTVREGLVPRVLPLRWIPQKEIYLYAIHHNIPIHQEECPYAVDAHRRLHQELLFSAEEADPGTRHSLLRLQEAIQDMAARAGEYNGGETARCQVCGEISSGSVCKACEIKGRLGLLGDSAQGNR